MVVLVHIIHLPAILVVVVHALIPIKVVQWESAVQFVLLVTWAHAHMTVMVIIKNLTLQVVVVLVNVAIVIIIAIQVDAVRPVIWEMKQTVEALIIVWHAVAIVRLILQRTQVINAVARQTTPDCPALLAARAALEVQPVIQPIVALPAPTGKPNPPAREPLIATLIAALRRPILPRMHATVLLATVPYIGTQQPFNMNPEPVLAAAMVQANIE